MFHRRVCCNGWRKLSRKSRLVARNALRGSVANRRACAAQVADPVVRTPLGGRAGGGGGRGEEEVGGAAAEAEGGDVAFDA